MWRSRRNFMRVGCGILMWSSLGRMHGVIGDRVPQPGCRGRLLHLRPSLRGSGCSMIYLVTPPPHVLAFHHPQDIGEGIAHTEPC